MAFGNGVGCLDGLCGIFVGQIGIRRSTESARSWQRHFTTANTSKHQPMKVHFPSAVVTIDKPTLFASQPATLATDERTAQSEDMDTVSILVTVSTMDIFLFDRVHCEMQPRSQQSPRSARSPRSSGRKSQKKTKILDSADTTAPGKPPTLNNQAQRGTVDRRIDILVCLS